MATANNRPCTRCSSWEHEASRCPLAMPPPLRLFPAAAAAPPPPHHQPPGPRVYTQTYKYPLAPVGPRLDLQPVGLALTGAMLEHSKIVARWAHGLAVYSITVEEMVRRVPALSKRFHYENSGMSFEIQIEDTAAAKAILANAVRHAGLAAINHLSSGITTTTHVNGEVVSDQTTSSFTLAHHDNPARRRQDSQSVVFPEFSWKTWKSPFASVKVPLPDIEGCEPKLNYDHGHIRGVRHPRNLASPHLSSPTAQSCTIGVGRDYYADSLSEPTRHSTIRLNSTASAQPPYHRASTAPARNGHFQFVGMGPMHAARPAPKPSRKRKAPKSRERVIDSADENNNIAKLQKIFDGATPRSRLPTSLQQQVNGLSSQQQTVGQPQAGCDSISQLYLPGAPQMPLSSMTTLAESLEELLPEATTATLQLQASSQPHQPMLNNINSISQPGPSSEEQQSSTCLPTVPEAQRLSHWHQPLSSQIPIHFPAQPTRPYQSPYLPTSQQATGIDTFNTINATNLESAAAAPEAHPQTAEGLFILAAEIIHGKRV